MIFCLGVSYLANQCISKIRSRQPDLEITDDEVRLVTLAGLTHDIGHGCYSHAFEGWVHRMEDRKGISKEHQFHHENMSNQILEYMVDDNGLDYDADEISFMQDLIKGVPSNETQRDTRGFLFEIVANKRNAIDVDKFDYLKRDSIVCGMASPDFKRVFSRQRV